MNVLFSLNLAIVIFMLASLLLGCVLGLSGSFIKDASSAVKNIMNQIDQINYDKLYLLDICINGNGSLAHYNYLSIKANDELYNKVLTNLLNYILQLKTALEQMLKILKFLQLHL